MNRTHCVLCGADATVRYSLPRERMQAELSRFLGADPPAGAVEIDYSLLRCSACELEFAEPMTPGNDVFYGWITTLPQYYVSHRWEWNVVIDRILGRAQGAGAGTLEVGCGSGNFMQRFHAKAALPIIGIDTTPSSVEAVRSRGLPAHVASLPTLSTITELQQRTFDNIVAFHCLEHVEDPLDFLRRCLPLLSDSGSIFISVPMSPMASEANLFDPLNHPPHHLSRWTDRSFTKAASLLHLDCRIDTEMPPPALFRALRALRIKQAGLNSRGLLKTAMTALGHPLLLTRATLQQLNRRKMGRQVAGDTLLVELSRRAADHRAAVEEAC